jgi:hypothetical protein
MRPVMTVLAGGRRVMAATLAVAIACLCMIFAAGSAVAQPTPPPTPLPNTDPMPAAPTSPPPPELTSLIDSAVLEAVQPSIVGLVTIWEKPVDPFAMVVPEPQDPFTPPTPIARLQHPPHI